MEIAERGAKLYDKFVGFVENLEKVGKGLDRAKMRIPMPTNSFQLETTTLLYKPRS